MIFFIFYSSSWRSVSRRRTPRPFLKRRSRPLFFLFIGERAARRRWFELPPPFRRAGTSNPGPYNWGRRGGRARPPHLWGGRAKGPRHMDGRFCRPILFKRLNWGRCNPESPRPSATQSGVWLLWAPSRRAGHVVSRSSQGDFAGARSRAGAGSRGRPNGAASLAAGAGTHTRREPHIKDVVPPPWVWRLARRSPPRL